MSGEDSNPVKGPKVRAKRVSTEPKKRYPHGKRKPREAAGLNHGEIIDLVARLDAAKGLGLSPVQANAEIVEHLKRMTQRGRAKKLINTVQLQHLAEHGWAIDEIAAFFNVSQQTIDEMLRRDPTFKAIMDRGKALGRGKLRSFQFQAAAKGNPIMLIWLGKQLLGQRDEPGDRAGDRLDEVMSVLEHARTHQDDVIDLPPIIPPRQVQ
jgi:hypothetical protein